MLHLFYTGGRPPMGRGRPLVLESMGELCPVVTLFTSLLFSKFPVNFLGGCYVKGFHGDLWQSLASPTGRFSQSPIGTKSKGYDRGGKFTENFSTVIEH